MSAEMCPRCRAVRPMRFDDVTRTVVRPDGTKHEVRTTTVHCATCGQFVRSENFEGHDPSPKSPPKPASS